jgi:hypothetical protein
MRRDSLSSLDDITSVFHNQSRTETPIDSIKPSRTNICTPYPLYQQKIRALLKPPDYQRNPPKFMSAREPQSEFERKEAAIQVKLLKKTFNTMHQRFNSVDKVLNILKSEAIKINSLRAVGENDLDHLKRRLEDLESEEDLMLSKIREEFNNNVIYKHIRERMRITLMHLEVKNQLLTDKIRVRDFLIESEHRKKTKTLENKYTKAQAYKNLKKTVHLDFKDRSADLEILSEDIKTREKIHELRRTRIKKYEEIAETAANEERDLKNNNKREAVQINSFWANFLKSKLEFYKRKYQKIVSAYERIQNVTMVSGIEEVVSRFLIKEQNFSELMGILSHNKEKCLKMIKKNDLIEGKIDDLLLSQKGGLDQNIANMKENLSFCISRTQKANQRLTRIRIVRDKVKSWSLKMMTKLGIRNNPRFCLREIFSLIQTEIFTRLQTKDRKSKGMFVTEL